MRGEGSWHAGSCHYGIGFGSFGSNDSDGHGRATSHEEIAPLPHVDPPVPEDEVPIEMNEDEDDEGNCASASSGLPRGELAWRARQGVRLLDDAGPRRRRCRSLRLKKKQQKTRKKPRPRPKTGRADNIARAPWRQKLTNPRDEWLLKEPRPVEEGSSSARRGIWADDQEEVSISDEDGDRIDEDDSRDERDHDADDGGEDEADESNLMQSSPPD